MAIVTPLAEGLYCIDLQYQDCPGVIASYLLEDAGERALIEVGPTSTLPTLLAALQSLDVDPASISSLIVTHIHLDHAGASGSFIRRFPRARLFVHEIGAPHMIDPSRLLASATRIYGDMMDQLWGDVEPVPAGNITTLRDGDTVTVGNTALNVLYTPGHASHHVVFHHRDRGIIFTGDVATVRMQGLDYIRPATPPPDIDLEAWSRSLARLRELDARTLCLTHFGPFTDVERHLRATEENLYAWANIVSRGLEYGQAPPEITDAVRFQADGELRAVTDEALVLQQFDLAAPLGMSVDGYLRYFKKRGDPHPPDPRLPPAGDGGAVR